jgi:redox-sensitive bicupin YhaK (pirin superfamily)
MRSILNIHNAVYDPIADLVTYRALPTASIQYVDPFLFLNHHGPQTYPPNNHGLPFGPHPHRGFETVTFVIDGDIFHKDSSGNQGTILPGGVQWMTAGSGLIHAEVSSKEFKKNGGKLEILQLWVNLPARHKMAKPSYTNLQKLDIPTVKESGNDVVVHVVSGGWHGTAGAYQSISDVHVSIIEIRNKGKLTFEIDKERNVFFYVIRGGLQVNGSTASQRQLVQFDNDEAGFDITALEDSLILIGHALPFNEPVVAEGPFVMNTREEIVQAYADFRDGKLGIWNQ